MKKKRIIRLTRDCCFVFQKEGPRVDRESPFGLTTSMTFDAMLFEDGNDLVREIRLSGARVGRGDGQEHGEQAIQAVHGEIL